MTPHLWLNVITTVQQRVWSSLDFAELLAITACHGEEWYSIMLKERCKNISGQDTVGSKTSVRDPDHGSFLPNNPRHMYLSNIGFTGTKKYLACIKYASGVFKGLIIPYSPYFFICLL